MTADQEQAFYEAAGFHASSLSFDMKLFVGGLSIVSALCILAGLMHLLNTASPWDKTIFMMSLFALSFILMMIFAYVA